MCRRFMAGAVNVTGSADKVGPEAAGRSIGLVPGDRSAGTTPPTGQWRVAADLAELTVAGPIEDPRVSRLTLGVEAI